MLGRASSLPAGATLVVEEVRSGDRLAICASTGEGPIKRGAREIAATAVWAGEGGDLRKLDAGPGACHPAWSPDGRRLAVTSADGLWVFQAGSWNGVLRVRAQPPMGALTEFSYRAFAEPKWSPDGALLAMLVSNGGTSWVEVIEASTGRLFYTSPPAMRSFSWGTTARDLKVGELDVHLPPHP